MYHQGSQQMNSDQIIVIGHWPPPYGGISSHLKLLLPALAKKGYQISLLDINGSSYALELHYEDNINIYRLNIKRYLITRLFDVVAISLRKLTKLRLKNYKLFFYGAAISTAIKFIQSNKEPDITSFVISHDNDNSLFNLFTKKQENTYFLNSIYAAFYLRPEYYANHKSLFRGALSNSDCILSCSSYCANSANKFLGTNIKTEVLYNNVDESRFHPDNSGKNIRKEHQIPENSFVLLFIGRMFKEMGVKFLLDNFSELSKGFPNLVLLVVGAKGPLLADVVKMSKKYPTNFKYKVNISDSDKPYYYACADVFTAPTIDRNACMGISNIEAMMTGRPVISSLSGGHTETIDDNKSGFLIPFDSNGNLCLESYIKKLKILYNSRSTRHEMGIHARKRAVKLFSNDNIVKQHISLFEQIKSY